MASTDSSDGPTRRSAGSVRLRVDVYDALAAAKGYPKVARQARWHGVSRSTMNRLRAGGQPASETLTRIAADLDVATEVIWERMPAA